MTQIKLLLVWFVVCFICITKSYDQEFYYDLCSEEYLHNGAARSFTTSACSREQQLKAYNSAGHIMIDIFPSVGDFQRFCAVRCKGDFKEFSVCRLCSGTIRKRESNEILKHTKRWCKAYRKSQILQKSKKE